MWGGNEITLIFKLRLSLYWLVGTSPGRDGKNRKRIIFESSNDESGFEHTEFEMALGNLR